MVQQGGLAAASLQHQDPGSIPGLAQWVRRIWRCCSCSIGHNCGLDLIPVWELHMPPGRQKRKQKQTAIPVMAQRKRIQLGTTRFQVPSLASICGLRFRHCCGCGVGRWQQLRLDP